MRSGTSGQPTYVVPSAAVRVMPGSQQPPVGVSTSSSALGVAPPVSSPAAPKVSVKSLPETLPQLRSLTDNELQYLQANPLALDDWLLDLPQAREATEMARELREANSGLARDILSRETAVDDAASKCEQSRIARERQQAVVDELTAQRDEMAGRRAPERALAVLAARAQQSDAEAEAVLQEALNTPGAMDASGLAAFKQRYVGLKTEKHMRLATQERLAGQAR